MDPFFALPQNNLMPNGEANVTRDVFEIPHADRHSAGHYRCAADNRVGAADTREIFVNVLCKEIIIWTLSDIARIEPFLFRSCARNRSRARFHSHGRRL